MKIKEESVREILERADIVSVIGDYVKLKRSGRNYVALCPFHKEKTPSFTVSNEKALFYCFGCGTGGNVVTFLMKFEKLTFVEALETLAKKFGVKLEYEGGYYKDEDKELEKLYDYSIIASRYFFENLFRTNEGTLAIKYLKGRGIEEATIKTFGLGYALSAWDGFVTFIKKNNYDLETFEKLGLIIKKDNGEYIDRFRGRIIFPVYSPTGRVIAFGGRILVNDKEQPKYINSTESKIYVKGKTLFGLFHSKDEIRKHQSAILVEGYMDLLMLYQNGIKNIVASAGTALTLDQIYILSRIAPEINLVFDGDQAGQKAAVRSIELLLQTETNFKIITLPEEEDPDSFVKKFGPEKFSELISKGKNYINFIYDLALKHNSLSDSQSRLKVINSLIEYTSRVRDPLRREILAREIAKKFNVTANTVLQKLDKYVKNFVHTEEKQIKNYEENKLHNVENEKVVEISPVEKGILKLICEVDHIYLEPIFSHIEESDFINPYASKIFGHLKSYYLNLPYEKQINGQLIINELENEKLKSIFADALIEKYKVSDGWNETEDIKKDNTDINKLISDYIKNLKDLSISKKIEELNKTLLSNSELVNNEEIIKEIQNLLKLKNSYQNFQIKVFD